MYICRAILKHGMSNFSLTILEYCEPKKCLEREKHYWGLLNPEYNIAKDPTAPFSGRKHSPESIKKMSDANKGENHPHFGKTGENHPMFGKCRAEGAGRPSQAIEVLDLNTNQTTTYESIREAARALSISQNSISQYFAKNQQKPCKRRYVFKKLS
jgi:group I intron endonuclease